MSTALAGAIRVSVLSPEGRVDLSLPGGVAVAEVTAQLATRLGLDPELTLGTVLGDQLLPEGTVGSQVSDGAVLQIVNALGADVPVVHDDICEAVREVLAAVDCHPAMTNRGFALGGSAMALAVGLVAAVLGLFGLPFALGDPVVGSALVLLLLTTGIAPLVLPHLALTAARLGNATDSPTVRDAVDRGHSVLLVGLGSVGLALVLLVPAAMARGGPVATLALDVAVGFLLAARSLPRWQMVAATLLLGSLALLLGSLAALTLHPPWRMVISVTGVVIAGALALAGSAPERFDVRLTWLGDGATWLTRFMLVPLGLWGLGLFTGLVESSPW